MSILYLNAILYSTGFLSSTTLSFDFSLGFLTNVNCNGTESRLLECGSSGFGVSVCRGNRVEAECFGMLLCQNTLEYCILFLTCNFLLETNSSCMTK